MQEERALELLELRRILEPAAAALATVRMAPAALAELGTGLAEMEHSRGETRINQDIDFGARIALASGNQTLATMLNGISGRTVYARIWHGALDAQADRRAHDDLLARSAGVAVRLARRRAVYIPRAAKLPVLDRYSPH